MSDNEMLYCLIVFIFGWLIARMTGEGFSVGGKKECKLDENYSSAISNLCNVYSDNESACKDNQRCTFDSDSSICIVNDTCYGKNMNECKLESNCNWVKKKKEESEESKEESKEEDDKKSPKSNTPSPSPPPPPAPSPSPSPSPAPSPSPSPPPQNCIVRDFDLSFLTGAGGACGSSHTGCNVATSNCCKPKCCEEQQSYCSGFWYSGWGSDTYERCMSTRGCYFKDYPKVTNR